MRYTTLTEIQASRDFVDSFGGYNHNLRIRDGEFYDMENLTSDNFPVLSPRGKRGRVDLGDGAHRINGMIAKDSLCWVDGTQLFIGGEAVEDFPLDDSPKQMVSMGAYIIIFPDAVYINTKNLSDKGSIASSYSSAGTVTFSMCRVDGEEYEDYTISDVAPENPSNMDYWLDTSTNPHTLKQYAATTAMWVAIATTYVRIAAYGIAAEFGQYDAVKISGIDPSFAQLSYLEGQVSPLWEVHHDAEHPENDYIVVVGIIDEAQTQDTPISVSRSVPVMDFVIESQNRLWGCRYGANAAGDVVNEIYASKLGDFKNWNVFMGLTTDSYVASCGTDGEWTGAVTHLGYPTFFKENCLHKVYGNYPSNYQIQTTDCRGVQKGCGASLAIVNETVYYKSRSGVCAYDGSLPGEVSSSLGNVLYSDAVAGSLGNKYYISMKAEDGAYDMFVFDTASGLWHREDNLRVEHFCSFGNEMYAVDSSRNGIITMRGSGTQESKPVKWMCETGTIGTSMPDKKYISRMNIRMNLAIGTRVIVYIQYNSENEWHHVASLMGTNLRTFTLPIRPKRCDHFRLKLEGVGDAKIYSVSKTIEQGSDV